MKKRILVLAVFIIMSLCMLCGCQNPMDGLNKEPNSTDIDQNGSNVDESTYSTQFGGFYTLQEAYDTGILIKEDLENIAYYTNKDLIFPEVLDSDIEKKIKNDIVYDIRNDKIKPVKDAKAEGIDIFAYYGEYSGCYAVRIRSIYWSFPADVPVNWLEIGGVEICIVGRGPFYVWKEI